MSKYWGDDTEPVSKLKCTACPKSQRSLRGWYKYLYTQLCPKCFDKFTTGSKQDKLHVMSKLNFRSWHENASNGELEQELRKTASECELIVCDGCGKDKVQYRYENGTGEEGFYCSGCFKKRKNIEYAGFSMDRYNCGPFLGGEGHR